MISKTLYKLLRLYWKIRKPVVLGVRVLAFRGDEVLLVRMKYLNDWYLPGGGVKSGETCRAAAERELFEETGARAKELHFSGLYFGGRHGVSDHVALFKTTDFEFTPGVKPDSEIAEMRLFRFDQLPENTSPATARRIQEARSGQVAGESW